MASTKSTSNPFYDQWLEQQKSHFDNWTKYMQDMQKSFSDAFPGQGNEAYKQWYNQQFEQFKQMMDNWAKYQPQFPGMQNMNFKFPSMPNMPAMPGAEQAQAFFKDMYEKQQQMLTGMMGSNKFNPLQNMTGMQKDTMQSVFRMYDVWLDINRQVAKSVAQGGEEIAKQLPNGVMNESVKNMFASSDVYIKLLELWVPLMKRMQAEAPEMQDLKEMVTPEKYKEVMDRVFNFVSPESLQQFYQQATQMMEQLNKNAQDSVDQYQQMLAHNSKLLPELMAGDPQAAVKIYENMYEAYSKNLDPQLKSALGGRDAEVAEITKNVITKVTEYVQRYAEMQHQLYVAGQKAMEGAIEEQQKLFSENKQPTSFSDFFQQWIGKNQAVFAEIFKSKEFTKMQSDLMDAGMDIKGEFQNLMEIYMADYPVVSRSEMDALSKKVQALQTKLRKLEGGSEVTEEVATEKPAPKTRTTAKKA